ncbi:glycosyl transferase family protein [Rhodophyticola sp. CCM32]|uniref:glycosyl transferase family protein n=1 Tax=Rhodophyticola sp. CCM32 TaxID=2916397 RepID=UPI00107FA743|nr:glycosyl transferase family protein [Rhodophyticola sp. CCM32]QBY01166.1 glycosyl transferase family protein [Rhodophyticola sp. CCM32]
MSLAPHIRILGRGPGRSRSLTREEAEEAMGLMLDRGQAAPEAIGALLMLLRMKGEIAEEIAGFAAAAQAALPRLAPADLDWPSYAAGRTRGLPWFLLSARLVAAAGHSVLLHGWNGQDQAVRSGLHAAQIPVLKPAEAMRPRKGLAYLPLETLSPRLFDLLGLRQVLGLRSCLNTVCRMLNPARAQASVQGVFHPSYRLLQADAAVLLGWKSLTVIKGGGGEFERLPSKDIAAFGLRNGSPWAESFPRRVDAQRRLAAEGPAEPTHLGALWQGDLTDPFAEAVVIGTAALALHTLGHARPEHLARGLWTRRHRAIAA